MAVRFFLLFYLIVISHSLSAQNQTIIFKKATVLYDRLSSQHQEEAIKNFSHGDRTQWSYVPTARTGVSLKEMDAETTRMVFDLLASLLSESGINKTREIIELEDILRETEGRSQGDSYRDKGKYYLNFFDQPLQNKPWALSFEGHHLSLNFTFVGDKISGTPLFMGANPAEVRIERSKGKQVLKEEERLGRELVKSLNKDQKKKTIISSNAPFDIETRSATKISINDFEGIIYTELNSDQKQLLKNLVNIYLGKLDKELADKYLHKIETWGWESLYFVWEGGVDPGQGHYYKITGPTLLIEYDNTQDGANHIHTVWRDSESDFGEDLLKDHYANSPHHK